MRRSNAPHGSVSLFAPCGVTVLGPACGPLPMCHEGRPLHNVWAVTNLSRRHVDRFPDKAPQVGERTARGPSAR